MRSLLALLLLFPSAAVAGLHDPEWNPPAQFDKPYAGQLVVHRVPVQDVGRQCGALFKRFGYKVSFPDHGCSSGDKDGRCEIVLPLGPVQLATPAAILRHEIGHCNGWSARHPQ